MKTRAGSIPVHLCVLLALAISVVVVAASITPSTAHARPRLENTSPLSGDPTDTEDGPKPGPAKAMSLTRNAMSGSTWSNSAIIRTIAWISLTFSVARRI